MNNPTFCYTLNLNTWHKTPFLLANSSCSFRKSSNTFLILKPMKFLLTFFYFKNKSLLRSNRKKVTGHKIPLQLEFRVRATVGRPLLRDDNTCAYLNTSLISFIFLCRLNFSLYVVHLYFQSNMPDMFLLEKIQLSP